jgi:hypothetical protein
MTVLRLDAYTTIIITPSKIDMTTKSIRIILNIANRLASIRLSYPMMGKGISLEYAFLLAVAFQFSGSIISYIP